MNAKLQFVILFCIKASKYKFIVVVANVAHVSGVVHVPIFLIL